MKDNEKPLEIIMEPDRIAMVLNFTAFPDGERYFISPKDLKSALDKHFSNENQLLSANNVELSELQEKYNTLASHFEFALTQLYHDPKKVKQRLIEAGLKEQ